MESVVTPFTLNSKECVKQAKAEIKFERAFDININRPVMTALSREPKYSNALKIDVNKTLHFLKLLRLVCCTCKHRLSLSLAQAKVVKAGSRVKVNFYSG